MRYSIVGTGKVGRAIAGHFARQQIEVAIANSRGPASIADLVKELGPSIIATTLDAALDETPDQRAFPPCRAATQNAELCAEPPMLTSPSAVCEKARGVMDPQPRIFEA
jgi:3-hydroxyacyl-CoA dehydrogenase